MRAFLIFAVCSGVGGDVSATQAQGYRSSTSEIKGITTSETAAVVPPKTVASVPLTEPEQISLQRSVAQCWNTGALDAEALKVSVTVEFTMNPDATPDNSSLRLLSYRDGTETAAQQAYEAARRAIIRCGARGFALPAESYDQWRKIEITFNPARMRNK